MSIKTREQERAENAWGKIERVSANHKEYGSRVRDLPAMIQTNGLGQSLAFLKSKAKNNNRDYHAVLYSHLSTWLGEKIRGQQNDSDFLTWIITQNSDVYRRATTEALAYTMWLRRFAEAQGWSE